MADPSHPPGGGTYGSAPALAPLSQLSDLADLPEDGPTPPLPAAGAGLSQDLAVPSQFAPSQFGVASQAFGVWREDEGLAAGGALAPQPPAPPPPPPRRQPPQALAPADSGGAAAAAAVAALAAQRPPAPPPALRSPARGRARRGPMDEMRQLVRILVKLIPHSAQHVAVGDDGGGNRLAEDQIKAYLAATLGDAAPRPQWGLPAGWAHYLATLYAWVLGRPVTPAAAAGTARRDPGRSWEAVPSELAALGLHPRTWPLPLTAAGLAAAAAHPVDQGEVAGGGASPQGKRRRGAGGAGPSSDAAPAPPAAATALDLGDLDEAGLWRVAATALQLADARAGSAPPAALPALRALRAHVAATAARLAAADAAVVLAAPYSRAERERSPPRGGGDGQPQPTGPGAPSPGGGRRARGSAAHRAPSD